MADSAGAEQRSVEFSELKSRGVKLQAGHAVVLVVGGVHGTPRRQPNATLKPES
jgi:hypothetical protein